MIFSRKDGGNCRSDIRSSRLNSAKRSPRCDRDVAGNIVALDKTNVLTSERYRQNRVAVAERDGELAGIAMSGPPQDDMAAWTRQLYVLYVYAAALTRFKCRARSVR